MVGMVSQFWGGLTERQKVVASVAGGWAGAWAFGRVADVVTGAAWHPLQVVLTFLDAYIWNGYVGCAILGAVIIGFWSNITSAVRKFGFALTMLGAAMVGIGIPVASINCRP